MAEKKHLQRKDAPFYDTHLIGPQEKVRFFDKDNIGRPLYTNIETPRCVTMEWDTYLCLAIGVRLVGKSRDDEDIYLDHLRTVFTVGNQPQWEGIGPCLSMLRHVFSAEEIKRLGREIDGNAMPRVGYHFARPIFIPRKQNFSVYVQSSKELPEISLVRVQLFGVLQREIK